MGKTKDKKAEKRKHEEEEEVVEDAPVVEEAEQEKKKKKKKNKEAQEEEEVPAKKEKKHKKEKEVEDETPVEEVKQKKEKKDKKAKEPSPEPEVAIPEDSDSDDSDEEGGGPVVAGAGKLLPDVPGRKAPERTQADVCTRVFVGNLSFKIEEQTLIDFFADCGPVESIDWMTDKESGKFYGTAFVEFNDPTAAQEALKLNSQELLGRPVKVEISRPKKLKSGTYSKDGNRGSKPLSEKPEYCNTVFVGGLPAEVTDDNMFELFNGCGSITKIRWVLDKASGEFRGCGFVEFEDDSYIDKAVAKNATKMMGRSLRIDYAASSQ